MIHIPEKIPFCRSVSDESSYVTEVVETLFGQGYIAEQRADSYMEGRIIVIDVIQLKCGATLYRPLSAKVQEQQAHAGCHRRHNSDMATL